MKAPRIPAEHRPRILAGLRALRDGTPLHHDVEAFIGAERAKDYGLTEPFVKDGRAALRLTPEGSAWLAYAEAFGSVGKVA